MTKVLILDQSKSVRNILRERLEYEGFSAEAVENEAAASALCERIPFDVILSDTECKVPDAGIPFIALSADTSIDTAVKAVRNGAQDFLTKPIDMNRLLQSLHRTIDNPAPAQAPPAAPPVRRRRAHSAQAERIIGVSPEIEHVRQLIDKVAPCEARVLITGENGTGKEHIAHLLHDKSKRAGKPFVAVDCGSLSKELAPSAFFGHVKGAFTGADNAKKGYFHEAEGGTLFLDEVGNLALETQQMLLRAIQERRYRPVGDKADRNFNVRIIAATNEDLEVSVNEKRFRQDLLYRLHDFGITVPPLRDCQEDIMPLAEFFRDMANRELECSVSGFSSEARKALLTHAWPGNVRELRQKVMGAVLQAQEGVVMKEHLELAVTKPTSTVSFALRNDAEDKERILRALKQANGNRSVAAELLGIGRTTLYSKLEEYGLKYKFKQS